MTQTSKYPEHHILHSPDATDGPEDTRNWTTEVSDIAWALKVLATTQLFSAERFTPETLHVSKDNVRQYAFALCGEVHEVADELGWKAWKKDFVPNQERLADEFADVLAFLGILTRYVMEAGALNEWDLAAQYRLKSAVNLERMAGQVEGYGVGLGGAPVEKHNE